MNPYGRAGGQGGHYQHYNVAVSQHSGTVTPRTLFGMTFDGLPFTVHLDSSAFDHGASAGIYRGLASWGPWRRPLVVAVKVFGHMLKPAQQQLLLRELSIASQASLRHPLILPFLGTVDSGDQKSLVSLYMGNGNLLEYLKSHRGCDKKKLLLQVAEAVNYLHSQAHLVHGDLKCENVLISDSGKALLADFGLSTFVEKSQFDATTMTSIRDMNTVRFAAPELLRGTDDPAVRPRSKTVETDVYAFGMLILQAVTELPPWFDLNAFGVVHKICQGVHPPRPTANGFVAISHSWWDVCHHCWSPEPGDRPTMNAVLSLLGDSALAPHRRLLHDHNNSFQSVAYFPDGRRVVSASANGNILTWETLTGRTVIGPLRGHDWHVSSVAVSPDGRQICSGGGDRTIRRWDAESGAPIGKPMTGHGSGVRCVSFSPDGTRIASCSDDRTVRLWDAATGEALGPLIRNTDWVCSVAFSPDGACIASTPWDGTIRLWDGATGVDLAVLRHHETNVISVCFSPDRIHLVSGCGDGSIRLWNVSTRQLARNIKAHSALIRSVTVSPSGRYIASGSDDGSIRIWDAHTGDAVGAPLIGHTDAVFSVAFSPDGRSLVSGSDDDTIRIWDIFE